jgi:hypothetical protein
MPPTARTSAAGSGNFRIRVARKLTATETRQIVATMRAPRSTRSRPARSNTKLTIAKLPLAKDLNDFRFEGTPINQTLVNDLAGGGFIAQQRNVVLVGGTEPAS